MIVKRERLYSKNQTGRRMYWLARRFSGDISKALIRRNGRVQKLTDLSLGEVYDVVRSIPYRRDDKPVEVVARPLHILAGAGSGADCKKKSIILGAWLHETNKSRAEPIRWRFVGVSSLRSRRIHHVLPQIKIDGEYKNVDATYPKNKIFDRKKYTAMEVL